MIDSEIRSETRDDQRRGKPTAGSKTMQAVLSELTLREIEEMSRKELLEAYCGFTAVCRNQPAQHDLQQITDRQLRNMVCLARRQYRVRGY
jgi:hypothetical protein